MNIWIEKYADDRFVMKWQRGDDIRLSPICGSEEQARTYAVAFEDGFNAARLAMADLRPRISHLVVDKTGDLADLAEDRG